MTVILSNREARRRLSIGNTIFYTQISDGLITTPVRVGKRRVGIPEHEIEAIVRARVRGDSDDAIRKLVRQLVAARKAASGGDHA